jgi:hypothetical protein
MRWIRTYGKPKREPDEKQEKRQSSQSELRRQVTAYGGDQSEPGRHQR